MKRPLNEAALAIQIAHLLAELFFHVANHLGSFAVAQLFRERAASCDLIFKFLLFSLPVHNGMTLERDKSSRPGGTAGAVSHPPGLTERGQGY
jgi:hypothetical protein